MKAFIPPTRGGCTVLFLLGWFAGDRVGGPADPGGDPVTVDPTIPAPVVLPIPVTGAGSTDSSDLEQMLADDVDIETHRQAIADRHLLDAAPAVQLSLSRIAGLTEQLAIEVRFIRHYFGEV